MNVTASIAALQSANDTKNGGVNWTSFLWQHPVRRLLNPTSTASGSSTVYTAPSVAPAPDTVTVTATSVTDNTKSASATIAIAGPQPAVLADGTYVYHLSGQDNNDNYYVATALLHYQGRRDHRR